MNGRRRNDQQLSPRLFDLGSSTDGPPILLHESAGEAQGEGSVPYLHAFRAVLADAGALECRSLAVVNAGQLDGSGHVAAGLAIASASLGKSVALVSAHIEPIVALAAEELAAGLQAAIALKKPLSEVTVPIRTTAGNLIYLPPGSIHADIGLLPYRDELLEVIQELNETNDLVIVELPPALDDVFTASVAASFDQVLLCTAGRRVERRASKARTRLLANGIHKLDRVHLSRPHARPIFVGAGSDRFDNHESHSFLPVSTAHHAAVSPRLQMNATDMNATDPKSAAMGAHDTSAPEFTAAQLHAVEMIAVSAPTFEAPEIAATPDVDLTDDLVIDLRDDIRDSVDERGASDRDRSVSVSVVIPCRNEEASIEACLDSVQAQSHRNLEIIVVDGMSDDRTVEIVKLRALDDPRIKIISNPKRIVSPGLNLALAEAKGRWLVRIDAHCAIPVDYVERVVTHLQTGKYGGVGGLKLGVGHTRAGRAIAAAMTSPIGVGNSTYHHGHEVQEVEHIPFGAYPVDLARSLGGWDETVLTNQDFEFDHRVGLAGRPLLFDPEVVIFWQCRQSHGALFRQYRRYGNGKSVVTRLHPDSTRPRHLVPAIFVAGLASIALPTIVVPSTMVSLFLRSRFLILGSYLGLLGYGASKVEQPEPDGADLSPVERLLVVPAFMAMHIGQGVGFWAGLLERKKLLPDHHAPSARTSTTELVPKIDLRDRPHGETAMDQSTQATDQPTR